jgi:uncharacterized protein (TIGR03382 family)
MRFAKSLVAGILATVLGFIAAVVVWVCAGYVQMWAQMSDGSGGIGAYSSGIQFPVLVSLAVGLAGFVWQWRRGRRLEA